LPVDTALLISTNLINTDSWRTESRTVRCPSTFYVCRCV